MDLDELRSAQSRERQASQLQHLRDGFYEEAASFIRGLRTERERAAANTDYAFPYDDPEVQQLTDEIQTAEEVVESLYERRVGKVVKMASFDAAGMAVDAEGLTAEEGDLFETLVGDIEANRARVLDSLAGTAGDDGGSADAGGAGTTRSATDATDTTDAAAAGSEAHADDARAPPEDEPVHIGSEPAAEGPVSTANESGDTRAPPEQAPTPSSGTEREPTREAEPETAPGGSGSQGASTAHDASSEATDDTPGDAMDAASAMGGDGGTGSDTGAPDVATGRATDAPTDGRPAGADPSTSTDPAPAADASATAGTDTTGGTDRQPVPPADGPPGRDPQSESDTPEATGTDAAAGTSNATASGTDAGPAPRPGTAAGDSPSADAGRGAADPAADPGSAPTGRSAADQPGDATPAADSPGSGESRADGTMVLVTSAVGEIFGVDGRAYDLDAGDVAVLPTDNARLLVEDGDAERLDGAASFSGGHSNRS